MIDVIVQTVLHRQRRYCSSARSARSATLIYIYIYIYMCDLCVAERSKGPCPYWAVSSAPGAQRAPSPSSCALKRTTEFNKRYVVVDATELRTNWPSFNKASHMAHMISHHNAIPAQICSTRVYTCMGLLHGS